MILFTSVFLENYRLISIFTVHKEYPMYKMVFSYGIIIKP